MVNVLAPSALDSGSNPGLVELKTIKLILVAKHAALRRKNKDWMAWYQDNVSEWTDCCFSEVAQVSVLDIIII